MSAPPTGDDRSASGQYGARVALIPVAALLSGHVVLAAEPGPTPAAIVTNIATLGAIAPVIEQTYHANSSQTERTYVIPVSNTGTAGAEALTIDQITIAGGVNSGRLVTDSFMSGKVSDLAAGATSNALTLTTRDLPIGGVLAMEIWLNARSVGSNVSLPQGTVAVSATVIPFAQPQYLLNGSVVSSVDFGAVRQGSTQMATLAVTNASRSAPQADLLVMGPVTTTGAGVTANGPGFGTVGGGTASGALLPGQTQAAAVTLALDTTTGGVRSGTITAGFLSDGGPSKNAVVPMRPDSSVPVGTLAPPMPVPVTGTVYTPALPVTKTTNLTLAARVGDASVTKPILATNAATGPYAEWLLMGINNLPAGLIAGTGDFVAAAGFTAVAGTATLLTSHSGDFSGKAIVGYQSMMPPATQSALPFAPAGTGTVDIAAHVYQPALAIVQGNVVNSGSATPVNAGTLNFGVVHVGDKASRSIDVANAAPAVGANDTVWGAITSAAAGFSPTVSSLPPAGVAAATSSKALTMTMDTTTAGVRNGGTVAMSLFSRNPDMADLLLGNATMTLTGTVNNHATLALANPTLGHLDPAGTGYILKLGSIVAAPGALAIAIDILNTASGPADLLDVTSLNGVSGPAFGASISAVGIAAGQAAARGLRLLLPLSTPGDFSYGYTLEAGESNSSGYFAALSSGPVALTIEGTVLAPEPWAVTAMATGLVGLMGARMRRRRRER